ncbi:unnamed protein product, partial [Amoebophrya sp. A25]|eukprot:GSA25T00002793001.1
MIGPRNEITAGIRADPDDAESRQQLQLPSAGPLKMEDSRAPKLTFRQRRRRVMRDASDEPNPFLGEVDEAEKVMPRLVGEDGKVPDPAVTSGISTTETDGGAEGRNLICSQSNPATSLQETKLQKDHKKSEVLALAQDDGGNAVEQKNGEILSSSTAVAIQENPNEDPSISASSLNYKLPCPPPILACTKYKPRDSGKELQRFFQRAVGVVMKKGRKVAPDSDKIAQLHFLNLMSVASAAHWLRGRSIVRRLARNLAMSMSASWSPVEVARAIEEVDAHDEHLDTEDAVVPISNSRSTSSSSVMLGSGIHRRTGILPPHYAFSIIVLLHQTLVVMPVSSSSGSIGSGISSESENFSDSLRVAFKEKEHLSEKGTMGGSAMSKSSRNPRDTDDVRNEKAYGKADRIFTRSASLLDFRKLAEKLLENVRLGENERSVTEQDKDEKASGLEKSLSKDIPMARKVATAVGFLNLRVEIDWPSILEEWDTENQRDHAEKVP